MIWLTYQLRLVVINKQIRLFAASTQCKETAYRPPNIHTQTHRTAHSRKCDYQSVEQQNYRASQRSTDRTNTDRSIDHCHIFGAFNNSAFGQFNQCIWMFHLHIRSKFRRVRNSNCKQSCIRLEPP